LIDYTYAKFTCQEYPASYFYAGIMKYNFYLTPKTCALRLFVSLILCTYALKKEHKNIWISHLISRYAITSGKANVASY